MEKEIYSCLISRVSTNMKSQDSSIEYQNDVLTDFILKQPNEHFNPKTDIFSDRISGTKIDRKNSDFNRLMKLLGFEIVDTSKGDVIELSIKTNRKTQPKYNKIYCKSTSRFSRADFKGESLLDILKKKGIEVYFYDLHKGTSELSQEELKLYSLIDSNYSRRMSYSWKNSNVYKAKNKQALLRGKFFGYDNIKKDGNKYFVKNENEYKAVRKIVDLILNHDMGCDLISQELKKDGFNLDKSFINRLLKNRHYLGQEKYYDYSQDYLSTFDSDNNREYLKTLNYKWENCEYIEQEITEEEFNKIQEILQSRSHQGRGFRNPYLEITKKLKCGVCGKSFYSTGCQNYFKIRGFKCSTLRSGNGKFGVNCNNRPFYEDYLNEYLKRTAETFKDRQLKVYKQNLDQLLYLRVYLLNVLSGDSETELEDLLTKKESLEEQLEKLLLDNIQAESTKKVIEKLTAKIDKELNSIDTKINIILDLKNRITEIIEEINDLYSQIQKDYLEVMNRAEYSVDEMLSELKDITIYPKAQKKQKRNAVYFNIHTFLENEIYELVKDIYNSEIKEILDNDIIKESQNLNSKYFIIKKPTTEQIETANEIMDTLGLE